MASYLESYEHENAHLLPLERARQIDNPLVQRLQTAQEDAVGVGVADHAHDNDSIWEGDQL